MQGSYNQEHVSLWSLNSQLQIAAEVHKIKPTRMHNRTTRIL